MRTAELLALPLCGFVSHQLPDLQLIISLSSAENKLIKAALRIPPAKTESAMWHTISCASTVVNLSPSSTSFKIPATFTKHSFKGCGPGALPPDVTNCAPFGLISE